MKQNTSTTIYKVSNILGILGVLAFAVFAIFNTIPTAHAYYSQPSYNNNYRNGNWNNFNYNNYRQRPPQNIYNTQTPIYNYSNNYSGYHHDYDYGRSNNYSYPVTYPVYVPQYIPTQTYTPSYSYNYVPQYIPSYTPSYSNYYQYPTTYPTTYYQQPTQTTSYYQPITYQSNGNGLNVGCFADPSVASINEPVTWASEVTGGVAPYTYSWSGSDGISGTQNSVIKYYDTVGQKTAILTVTSAD